MEEPQNTPMDGASAAPSQDPNQQIDMTDSDSSMMANTGDNDPMMGNTGDSDPMMGGEDSMTMGDDMGGEDPMMNDDMSGEENGDDSTSSILNQLSPDDKEAVRAYAQSLLSRDESTEPQSEELMESFIFTKKQLTKIMESFRQSEIKKDEKPLNKKYSKSVSKKSPFNSPNFKK